MSRTIRRKNVHVPYYITKEWHTIWYLKGEYWHSVRCWEERPEQEVKRRTAKFYSDAGHSTYYHCSTKGRPWFKTLHQRCYRRDANRELHKFSKDEKYEVMILAKPKLPYWD